MLQLSPTEQALVRLGQALQARGYHFTTVTPATHARVNSRPGNEFARDLRDVFGWSRPFQEEVLPREILNLMKEADILVSDSQGWRSRLRVSTLSGMLFFHSAYPTDALDAVFFGPDTYRFARVIQQFLDWHPESIHRAVDIGCGAGPGAMLIAKARPETEILAVDINAAALSLTRVNATLNRLTNLAACYSDLLSRLEGQFDLIVANPPYLNDPAQRAYRHGGGPLGSALSLAIVETAIDRLAPGGSLLLYTGVAIQEGRDAFFDSIRQRLEATDLIYQYQELDPDVFGEELLEPAYRSADRIAAVALEVCRPSHTRPSADFH